MNERVIVGGIEYQQKFNTSGKFWFVHRGRGGGGCGVVLAELALTEWLALTDLFFWAFAATFAVVFFAFAATFLFLFGHDVLPFY